MGISNLIRIFKEGSEITFIFNEGIITFDRNHTTKFNNQLVMDNTRLNILCKENLSAVDVNLWYYKRIQQITLKLSPQLYYEVLAFIFMD